jgi:glycosyltransferase involved in cell wall biosynthesis
MRFGTVALTDPVRKGLAEMLDAFESLDRDGVQCELQIRVGRDGLGKVPRNVVVLRAPMPHAEYVNWIQSMECGLFPSRAEGFGIPQLEFSVCGRCVIAPCAGAVGEFLPFYDDNLILDGNSSYAEGAYKESGHWYSTPVNEIIRAVEYAVQNRYHVAHVGRLVRMRAAHFTWERTGNLLKNVFFRHGLN